MPTNYAEPERLVPFTDIDKVKEAIGDLTVRACSKTHLSPFVSYLFDYLGYTCHQVSSYRAEDTIGDRSWLLETATGGWVVFRVEGEDAFFRGSAEETVDEHWDAANIDDRIWIIEARLRAARNSDGTLLRGDTANDLFLALASSDHIEQKPDLVAVLDWLRDHKVVDLDEMMTLAALASGTGYEPDETNRPLSAYCRVPTSDYGPHIPVPATTC